TLAMLVNEGVDLVHRGEASAEDVDTAMRLGTNYPQGPFGWLAELGADRVRETLAELDLVYPGGRYRPSQALSAPAAPGRPPASVLRRRATWNTSGGCGRRTAPRPTWASSC